MTKEWVLGKQWKEYFDKEKLDELLDCLGSLDEMREKLGKEHDEVQKGEAELSVKQSAAAEYETATMQMLAIKVLVVLAACIFHFTKAGMHGVHGTDFIVALREFRELEIVLEALADSIPECGVRPRIDEKHDEFCREMMAKDVGMAREVRQLVDDPASFSSARIGEILQGTLQVIDKVDMYWGRARWPGSGELFDSEESCIKAVKSFSQSMPTEKVEKS